MQERRKRRQDAGRETGRVKREAGGGEEREAVERGGLGRKAGLGKQCLSFNVLFLAYQAAEFIKNLNERNAEQEAESEEDALQIRY